MMKRRMMRKIRKIVATMQDASVERLDFGGFGGRRYGGGG